MDYWKEHVSLEITDAVGDDDRMLDILNALLQMHYNELIPDDISDDLFNKIDAINSRSE